MLSLEDMKKMLFPLFLLLVSCSSNDKIDTETQALPSPATQEEIKTFASGEKYFACNLYEALSQGDQVNIVFSPHSLSAALTILGVGASGTTWKQIQEAFNWPLDQQRFGATLHAIDAAIPLGELAMYNALWVDSERPLLHSYTTTVRQFELGSITAVDFHKEPEEAREHINKWIDDLTKGKIKNLLSPGDVTTSTSLVITNGLHFLAEWESPFAPEETHDAPFYIEKEKEVLVPMMHQKESLPFFQDEEISLVKLFYKEKHYALYILVPTEEDPRHLTPQFLTQERLSHWTSELEETPLSLTMPRTKIKARFDLNIPFQSLGITDAFSSQKADFSLIDGHQDLVLSIVRHGTAISFYESGTEGAAATAAVLNLTATKEPPKEFVIDRPFLFFIMHEPTQSVLFMGTCVHPIQ